MTYWSSPVSPPSPVNLWLGTWVLHDPRPYSLSLRPSTPDVRLWLSYYLFQTTCVVNQFFLTDVNLLFLYWDPPFVVLGVDPTTISNSRFDSVKLSFVFFHKTIVNVNQFYVFTMIDTEGGKFYSFNDWF